MPREAGCRYEISRAPHAVLKTAGLIHTHPLASAAVWSCSVAFQHRAPGFANVRGVVCLLGCL